ncbi:MAG TPA: TonB family protein [Caulobacteraceae bacterium]
MRRFGVGLVLGLIAATAAMAAGGDTTPDWRQRLTAEDILAVYPGAALARGVGGRAMINCVVTVLGSVRDCQVVSESPPGYGFGGAAIALTPQFQFWPAKHDGSPVEAKINIPIVFSTYAPLTESQLPAKGSAGPVNLTQVEWRVAPNVAQVSAAYPEKARAARVGGLVTLACTFNGGGRIGNCEVVEETPKGYDFGRAARSLAGDFVGPDQLADGRSTSNDTTQLVIAFSPEMIDAKAPVIGKPTWTRMPEALDMAAAFPAAARAAHVDVGHVLLNCFVAVGGKLISCAVQKEAPAGLGFGAAAMSLSSQFQVSVWTDEGLPTVGGSVSVPIRYEAGSPVNSGSANSASAKP